MSKTVDKPPEHLNLKNEWETEQFLMMQRRFDKAAGILKLDPDTAAPMRHPKRCLSVTVPARMDDGSIRTYSGYRVHHDIALGPAKGGIRFRPGVNLGEVASMAMLMTWKCSLMGLPFGGAHGGVSLDPTKLSQSELERVTRRYISEIITLVGPNQDIPGPDLNTNQQTMSWIMDTYSVNVGHTVPSVVTGKPKSIGGSLGLTEATGYGVAFCARKAAENFKIFAKTPSVVVQGIGQVGATVAKRLTDAGFKVIGLSDSSGGIYHKDGLDIAKIVEHHAQGKSLDSFSAMPGAKKMSNDELLETECDILVPCAVAHVIHKENADKLRCKLLVEGANAPTTPEAEDILEAKKIIIMPDVVANASGVCAGYFEWVQGMMRLIWNEEEVYERLEGMVDKACQRIFLRAEEKNSSLRTAAISLAVERLVEARKLRGLYP